MKKTDEPFSIRKAEAEDCAGILECLAVAFAPYRDEYTPAGYLDTVLTPETLRKRMTEMSILVANDAFREIVGTIAWSSAGGEGHLRGMAVRPQCQGSGVGAELLDRALQELREAGCNIVTLDTTAPLRRAIHFYEKHGFRPSGRVADFFGMPLFEYSRRI